MTYNNNKKQIILKPLLQYFKYALATKYVLSQLVWFRLNPPPQNNNT
jgi:hypothetical protein